LRLNSKTDEGKKFKGDFNILGYPTVVFVTPQGEEIDRIFGFDGDRLKYFQTIKDYAAGVNTVADLQKNYKLDTLNVEANYRLAKKYIDRWEFAQAQPYLSSIMNLDPEDQSGHREECELNIAIYEARFKDVKNPQPLIAFLKKTNNEKYLDEGYSQLFRYYKNGKDTTQYFNTLEEAISKMPINTDVMNKYAWDVFKYQMQPRYSHAIEVAEKAVQLKPNASGIWDTLAWLYVVGGDSSRAVKAIEKAIQIDPGYKERLDKIKKAIEEKRINFDEL
jgi:tetratricopeptide (TPR) repeat protein